MPLISAVMGTLYRRESLVLLERSVFSILNQTCCDFEFLICDDGSAPEAKRCLEEYSRHDGRIRLIRPGNKLNLASKLNACLHEARGQYIARMDDDDCSHATRFQKQVSALEARTDIEFVGSNVSLNRNGTICGARTFPEFPEVKDFYMTQPYIHPALMFRKNVLNVVGGYSENRRQVLCEDYDLLLRLYAKGYRGMNLQETLLEYTIQAIGKRNRRLHHRWNEAVTRWARFRDLGVLPRALPYVVKPLAVGLIPERVRMIVKGSD